MMSETKKSPKRRKMNSTDKASGDVITDPRFANIQSDPRYRLPSKKHTRVKIDKRFSHMLHDKDFSRNAAVDRYGRKLCRDDTKKQLERFYRIGENDGEDDGEEKVSADDDDEVQKELRRVEKEGYDPARDGGFSESSSSEESSSDEESEEEVEDEAAEAELPAQQQGDVPLGEVSERIAVVNLDWDNIRAADLMAVFSSFLPAGGKIRNVTVYPSEFGKERMEREEMEGPPKELFAKKDADPESDLDDGEDDESEEEKIKQSIVKEDEGKDFDSAQLRKYQLERLRYYYAILTCSSKDAAKAIYDAVDGTEYMSSANFFDLRFVPESTDFTDDVPRDECDRIPDGYKPNDFVTDALQHSKVKLTWDTEDKTRKDVQARAFKGGRKEIDENDLKAYLGSDSSSDEEEEVEVVDSTKGTTTVKRLSKKEAERARVRALLGLGDAPDKSSKAKDKGPVGEMEVTFSAGLSKGPARESVFENETEKEETTREKYVRKERERRQRRKEKMKAVRSGEAVPEDDGDKAEAEPEAETKEEEDLGFNDPFFTAPELDSAKVAAKRKEERRKVREQREADEAASAAKRAELELLMMDDKTSTVKHFDMTEIERAQKRARKAGKNKKAKKNATEAPADDFQMDVKDPRFQRLFESHEYAIDPTNPRFRPTDGMKALLEEGRKRRRQMDTEIPDGDAGEPTKKKKKGKETVVFKEGDADELSKLVERVKGKVKKR